MKSGSNLDPWAQKSTLRFMRTLRPSLVALAQSSWSLLLMALVTGPFLERIASEPSLNESILRLIHDMPNCFPIEHCVSSNV